MAKPGTYPHEGRQKIREALKRAAEREVTEALAEVDTRHLPRLRHLDRKTRVA